jgi:hypothetical protein
MTTDERAGDALFSDPLPEGFARRVFRVAPGHELGVEPDRLPEASWSSSRERSNSCAGRGPVGGSSAAR